MSAPDTDRLESLSQYTFADERPLRDRINENPTPAVLWLLAGSVLLLLEAGAVLHFCDSMVVDSIRAIPEITTAPIHQLHSIPTLLSRATIPNQGYWNGSQWVGTFLELSPAAAWALRVILVYGYTAAVVGWIAIGYRLYRQHYRLADWTPRDDAVDRFKTHKWGIFGLLIVVGFLAIVFFAPTLSTTTPTHNMYNPYSYSISYWSTSTHSVKTVLIGTANHHSRSVGRHNVGLLSYDSYGRFHPFGTLPTGEDLFTFLMYGARVSLVTAIISLTVSATVATALALVSAYYQGVLDLGFVLLADSILALPQLLLIIMLSVVLSGTWIANVYSGGFLLGLIFAVTGWPGLWRSIRGPALQVGKREWVEAAESFGQHPLTIMRKHMFPYVTGYLLVYGSMTLGGAILGIAGLSFLGLGVNPPTPEWGRAINMGQAYIGTPSWHISFIPGVLITILVLGFNALGDGIRDAIDPQSETVDEAGVGRGGGA